MEVVEMEHRQGERKPTDMHLRSIGNLHQQEKSGELLIGNQGTEQCSRLKRRASGAHDWKTVREREREKCPSLKRPSGRKKTWQEVRMLHRFIRDPPSGMKIKSNLMGKGHTIFTKTFSEQKNTTEVSTEGIFFMGYVAAKANSFVFFFLLKECTLLTVAFLYM